MKLGIGNSDKHVEYATHIYESGRHLLEVIDDILDVSIIETGKLELNEDWLRIDDIVASAMRILEVKAKKAELRLEMNIPANLPMFMADKRRLNNYRLMPVGSCSLR
jgi:signal transduction histidine kinase